MKDIVSLYRYAEKKGIVILRHPLPETLSMSIQTETGDCYVGIDGERICTDRSERVHLSHELGHCVTGSFYNRYAAADLRQRHEIRANKWAIRRVIPRRDFDAAIAEGHTELWDLADHFSVTEDFMRKAVCLYVHGNLAADLYF